MAAMLQKSAALVNVSLREFAIALVKFSARRFEEQYPAPASHELLAQTDASCDIVAPDSEAPRRFDAIDRSGEADFDTLI